MPSQFGLAVNCGSSSIKFQLYSISSDKFTVTAAGAASNLGSDNGPELKLSHSKGGQEGELSETSKETLEKGLSHEDVFSQILKKITSEEVLGAGGSEQIKVVAHR